jgi:tripartite-type tricarboxylate transporter receptor subunit TctC
VDNRAGAAGNIGVELAAHAAPDGYTLLAVTAAAAISQSLYREMSFDLTKDFAPVALIDVIAGNVSMALANTLVVLPHIRAGRLRAIAITSAKRSAIAPELPTIAESGLRGFESGTWYGLLAPAGTPRDVVSLLNGTAVRIVQLADVREKLNAQGAEPLSGTPEQVGEFVRNEIGKWGKVVKASGIRTE